MQHTSYEFQYEYLPDTIIHRLMIFCYQSHYHVRYRWRRGMSVDFGSDDTSRLTAVIDSGSDNRSITIEIYSDGRIPCWQFLSKLREEILQINEEINLKAKDFINMETDGIRDRFSVEAVLKKRARGWEVIPADNYDGDYKISEILGSAYGPVNAAFIEKFSVSQKGQIDKDSLDRILSRLNELFNAIGQISDRQKDMQIYQYLTKDWLDERLAEAIQNQEMMLALLNTLNSQPSKLKELGKKLLSGLAVTADIVTLVEAANPGTSHKVCEKVSEVIQVILRLQM
jgi:hypothetical protein